MTIDKSRPDALTPEQIQDRLHRFNSKRNTTALTVVSVTEFVLHLLAESRDEAPVAPPAIELAGVKETLEAGRGFWRTCSGCHESEDGHPVGEYPYSDVLRCDLGGGCSECGGIGAVWDNTDYDDMASFLDRHEEADEAAKTATLPAEPSELEQVVACLGDDAATLRDADQFIEMADNMERAAELLAALPVVQRPVEPVEQPVAVVESWTNCSYHRNYKLRWLKDVPAGAQLFVGTQPALAPADERTIVREIRRLADEQINTPKLSMELLAIANELARAPSVNQPAEEGALRVALDATMMLEAAARSGLRATMGRLNATDILDSLEAYTIDIIKQFGVAPRPPAQTDVLEDAYVAKRMAETLASVYATIVGDDKVDENDGLDAIKRVARAAQVLRLEVELYRAQAAAQKEAVGDRWIDKLLELLTGDADVTISADDASCYANAIRAVLSTDPDEVTPPNGSGKEGACNPADPCAGCRCSYSHSRRANDAK